MPLHPDIFDVINCKDLQKSHLKWLNVHVFRNDFLNRLSLGSGIANAFVYVCQDILGM